jgi:hypothetical protein
VPQQFLPRESIIENSKLPDQGGKKNPREPAGSRGIWASERPREGWQGFCEAMRNGVRLQPTCATPDQFETKMKHQRHFDPNHFELREVARISALISDMDRRVRLFDCDIAAEEQRARVSDRLDPGYPMFARTLAARRDNLKETIAVLEKRLTSRQSWTEQVSA